MLLIAFGLLLVVIGVLIGASWPRGRARTTPSDTEIDVVAHLVDQHHRLARLVRIAVDCAEDLSLYALARDLEHALVDRAGRMHGWMDAWGTPMGVDSERRDGWTALRSLRGARFDRQFVDTALCHLDRTIETVDVALASTASDVLHDLLEDVVSDLCDHRRRVESHVDADVRRCQPENG